MKQRFLFLLLIWAGIYGSMCQAYAEGAPDTVRVGIYVTSIHDIDFRQKEYSINCWLWLNYKNPEFDFLQNLEVPQAKSVNKSYATLDTVDGRIYILIKLQCIMKDSWKITNFPFDYQRLRLSIENSQFDSRSLVFVADTVGRHYDYKFTVSGWQIDSFDISTGIKNYETAFGDVSIDKPHTEYAAYKVKIGIRRDAWGLFWKMFLGMYVSFLIAFVCLYIHADNIDSRLALSVGSLFTAIGNKYIIDSALPESSSFTLVDTLHGLTLISIFTVITISVYALRLVKRGEADKARRMDMKSAKLLALLYVSFNVFFIWQAL